MKTKPSIFININESTFELINIKSPSDLVNVGDEGFNVVMCNGNAEREAQGNLVFTDEKTAILIVKFEHLQLWQSEYHKAIYEAFKKLFTGWADINYMMNVVGTYQVILKPEALVAGKAGDLDAEVFAEPSTKGFGVDNPEFVQSLYNGGEVKLDVVEEADEEEEPQPQHSPRDKTIRDQMDDLAVRLDTLETVHQHLPEVFNVDDRNDTGPAGIAFEYNGLNYLVNVVEGEEDLAAVYKQRDKVLVGIFLHDNVFVTKGHVRKSTMIDASSLRAYDFNAILVNYAELYESYNRVTSRRSGHRRNRARVVRG